MAAAAGVRGLRGGRALAVALIALLLCATAVTNYLSLAAGPERRDLPGDLLLDPLSAQPFLALAAEADRAGRSADALRLMETAERRNPYRAEVRAWLLARYAEKGRFEDAVIEADRFRVLRRDLTPQSLAVLAAMAISPQARPPLVAMLRESPSLGPSYFRAMAAQKIPPAIMAQMLRASSRGRAPGSFDEELGAVVGATMAAGDVARAKAVWSEFLPSGASSATVYDPDLRGLPGPAPFNWTTSGAATAFADFRREGGVELDFVPRSGARLVGQLLVLKPGRYRFSSRFADLRDPAPLAWTIRCDGGAQLVEVAPGRSAEFAVPPAGCTTQNLDLVTRDGDSSAPLTGVLRSVALDRIGG